MSLTPIRPGIDDPVLAVGVPIYVVWLTSTVSYFDKEDDFNFQAWRAGVAGEWLMFLGAFIFAISDCLIGINLFYIPVPNSQVCT